MPAASNAVTQSSLLRVARIARKLFCRDERFTTRALFVMYRASFFHSARPKTSASLLNNRSLPAAQARLTKSKQGQP